MRRTGGLRGVSSSSARQRVLLYISARRSGLAGLGDLTLHFVFRDVIRDQPAQFRDLGLKPANASLVSRALFCTRTDPVVMETLTLPAPPQIAMHARWFRASRLHHNDSI